MGSVGERPKTGEMLAALDSVFGGREEVLKRMDISARAAGLAVFPVPYFWAAHCASEVESPSTAPQGDNGLVPPSPSGPAGAPVADVAQLGPAESVAVGEQETPPPPAGQPETAPQVEANVATGSPEPYVTREPAGAVPEESGQDGLFGAGDLQEVAAKPGIHQSIYVHFENYEDIKAFGELIGLPVTTQTRQITYPPPNLRAVPEATQ